MSSFGRNSLWLLLARLTAQGMALLFVAMMARRMDIESFGRFTAIAAVVLIGNTFTNFGTDTYIVRDIARTRNMNPLVSNALGLQLLLSAAWWIMTLLLHPEPVLLTYSLALFPLALFSVATATLRGFERMDLVWTLSLLNGLFQVIAAFFSTDLRTLCLLLLVAQLLIAALCYSICHTSLPEFRLFPFDRVFPLLKATVPIALLTLLLVLSQRLGVLTVSAMLGDSSTALFSSATRLVDGLKLGHYAVLGGLLPILARRTEASKQNFRIGFLLLIGLSLTMAIALALFSRLILPILFGTNFTAASPLLSLLGWSLIPYTISSFISYELIANSQEITLVKATATALATYLVLNVWLISSYHLTGAVYAALAGETLQAIILFWFRNSMAYKFQIAPETFP